MNVAFCFSGQPRSFNHVFPSFKKHILRPLSGHNFYFFAHYPLVCPKTNLPKFFTDSICEDESNVSFDFHRLQGINHLVESRPWNRLDPLSAYLMQLRSIYLSYNLCRQYSFSNHISFDWVFRARFDNLYVSSIEPLDSLDPLSLYVPAHDSWNGYNDRFAFSGMSIMNTYASRFVCLSSILTGDQALHPETSLKSFLSDASVPVRYTRVVHHLLRHGELWKARFNSDEGDSVDYSPSQPGMKWRFQIKKYFGDIIYNKLSLAWWRLGI